ncbi:triose-phosphate isomerase [Patescibacteria group bacterium]|nr:triose-phosphate isomerase [Patescibacteria group bacterium]
MLLMKNPQIIVNFKTYASGSGERALELAKIHEKVARETGVNIAIAVQAVDLRLIVNEVRIPVFAQHFDFAMEGAFTGHVTPHSLKAIGAFGSLLNHSEKRISLDDMEKSVDLARNLGLFTVVCAESVYAGKAAMDLDPNMIAVEPPELIGGDVSVCTAKPQVILDAVQMIGRDRVLIGAGIKSKEDVEMAVKHGAGGILVASGITKAHDPEAVLRELAEGFIKGQKLRSGA